MESNNWYEQWYVVVFVIAAIVGGILLFLRWQKNRKPKGYKEPPKNTDGTPNVAYDPKSGKLRPTSDRALRMTQNDFVTPKGVVIRCEPKAKQWVNAEVLAALDAGIQTGIDMAKFCRNHAQQVQHNQIVVCFLESEISDSGTPGIRTPAGQYAGTEYDKGGYILAGAQFVAVDAPPGNLNCIAIPAPITKDYATVERVSRFEYEHCQDSHFDIESFYANQTHGAGNPHPYWGESCAAYSPAVRGFRSTAKPPDFICGAEKVRGLTR